MKKIRYLNHIDHKSQHSHSGKEHPDPPVQGHVPWHFTLIPASRAMQLFGYVCPFAPHTGSKSHEQYSLHGHLRSQATLILARFAKHLLRYVFPLLPHTGSGV